MTLQIEHSVGGTTICNNPGCVTIVHQRTHEESELTSKWKARLKPGRKPDNHRVMGAAVGRNKNTYSKSSTRKLLSINLRPKASPAAERRTLQPPAGALQRPRPVWASSVRSIATLFVVAKVVAEDEGEAVVVVVAAGVVVVVVVAAEVVVQWSVVAFSHYEVWICGSPVPLRWKPDPESKILARSFGS